MTKKWRVRMMSSEAHEYNVEAKTYEEAIKIVEEKIEDGETNPLTGKLIRNESYTNELISIGSLRRSPNDGT
tara:strand:+ start:3127 stop:3342 length:216 start_codon:yes stop_codon:yes gene_type:complete